MSGEPNRFLYMVACIDDGSPRYAFTTSFPSSGVRVVEPAKPTPEEAYEHANKFLESYRAADPYGNMGELLGVCLTEGGYLGVVNTYHSNT